MVKQNSLLSKYFESNIKFLKLTGFWVYDQNTSKKYFQHGYNIFWFVYIFIAYQPAEFQYLYYCYDDLNEFLRALRDNVRKTLLSLIDTLQGDYDYEDHGDFQAEIIIQEEKKQALKWTKYFFNFCNAICLSMFLNGLFTFIFNSEAQYEIVENERVYRQKQPVNTVSPFGTGTRTQFFITFIYTIVALTFYAWMIVALDSLFITLMSCISAHLKILQGAFKTLRNRCVERIGINFEDNDFILHDPPHLQDEVNREMVKCIKHLQTVLRVSEELEDIYSTQTFIQTFISLGEMCFSLYLLSETVDQNIGNEITYLIATGFELLMYCWFGNRLTEASVQLSYALYESNWFSTSLLFRKQMIFTMTRMQKPIYVTIGKITPLAFHTFLTIARGAYSFFTFLKQRHGIHASK